MSDIVTSRIFTDGEKGITAAKLNDIIGSSVIQPAFYTSKPTASAADPADVMLILKSGAYAQAPVSTIASSIDASQIWSTRLRSYNSLGNPNFSIDQRNATALAVNAPNGGWLCDRWSLAKSGTMQVNLQSQSGGSYIPGTTYLISDRQGLVQLNAQQTLLGPNDLLALCQNVEGSAYRELFSDVTSISLLVNSTVPNIKFSVALRSPDATQSLVKLCTVPNSGQWTLIQLPNIPVPTGGNFSHQPGILGYALFITLAAGSSLIASAADTWQNGNFIGAPGMTNWAANPNGTTFYVAMIQHEPGPVCSTFIDKPFSQNLDECLRQYSKSYLYGTAAGASSLAGSLSCSAIANQDAYGFFPFKKIMAKVPTVFIYNASTGVVSSARDIMATVDRAVNSVYAVSDASFGGLIMNTHNAAATIYQWHYTSDTGW